MTAMTQATENGQQTEGKSKYIIFMRVGDNTWEELGSVLADGAYAAREHAIEQYDLMDKARSGDLEIVSLGARFWTPKRPKVNVSESLDVS